MNTSLPIPTDNIYKFTCFFGLALIVTAIFAFTSVYTASLEKKIKYSESVIQLEARTERTKAEGDLLELNRQLIKVARQNEKTANWVLLITCLAGTVLTVIGASMWLLVIQPRDDQIAALQIEKLRSEIAKLRS